MSQEMPKCQIIDEELRKYAGELNQKWDKFIAQRMPRGACLVLAERVSKRWTNPCTPNEVTQRKNQLRVWEIPEEPKAKCFPSAKLAIPEFIQRQEAAFESIAKSTIEQWKMAFPSQMIARVVLRLV